MTRRQAGGGEQVLDHAGQVGGLGGHHAEHLTGVLGDPIVLDQDLAQAENPGQGRSELMAGVGHELVAGDRQLLFGLQLHLELALPKLSLHDLPVHQHQRQRNQQNDRDTSDVTEPGSGLVEPGDVVELTAPQSVDGGGGIREPNVQFPLGEGLGGRRLTVADVCHDTIARIDERVQLGNQVPGCELSFELGGRRIDLNEGLGDLVDQIPLREPGLERGEMGGETDS